MSPDLMKKLERAIVGGTHTIEDVEQAIEHRTMQLWEQGESAIVTQILQYPRIRSVEMFLMAGALSDLKDLAQRVQEFAKEQGADRMQVGGRPGWERALVGYESLGVFLVKDI